MNLWFRLLVVLLRAALRTRAGALDATSIPFRVLLTDLDTNLHMNNGRYLTLMDLGRMDLTVRTGLWRVMVQHRWLPVVAAANVRFRRELRLGASATLHTRLLGWDDRWFWLEHRIEHEGRIAAVALLRAVFLQGRASVPPSEVARALGLDPTSPQLPDAVAHARALEGSLG
jgi:acyl-CoA thioesterase FadM